MKVLACTVWNSQQSWHYECILKTGEGTKLAVRARWNAYVFQSDARVDVWSGTAQQWNTVVSMAGEEMRLPFNYQTKGITAQDFAKLHDRLIGKANLVLY